MDVQIKDYGSLSAFLEAIPRELADRQKNLIYRGMADADWNLESSLSRYRSELIAQCAEIAGNNSKVDEPALLEKTLFDSFKKNILINKDVSPELVKTLTDDDILQLGQHFGLPSPLLDWTKSPYVALYFALKDRNNPKPKSRAIWALDLDVLNYVNHRIEVDLWKKEEGYKKTFPLCKVVNVSALGINQRVEYQQGLFTKETNAEPVTQWIKRVKERLNIGVGNSLLIKYQWPEDERKRVESLNFLSMMNINDRVLFPDIEGSVKDAKASVVDTLLDRKGMKLSFSLSSNLL